MLGARTDGNDDGSETDVWRPGELSEAGVPKSSWWGRVMRVPQETLRELDAGIRALILSKFDAVR